MLTLDETTLFYFSLACSTSGPKIKTGAIDRWNNAVSTFGARSRPGSKASTTIAASTISKTSSAAKRFVAPSALTSDIQIQSSYPVKTEEREVDFGGVSDADETQGPEHEAAASSPMKGNTRKDSDVCPSRNSIFFLFNTNYHDSRISLS